MTDLEKRLKASLPDQQWAELKAIFDSLDEYTERPEPRGHTRVDWVDARGNSATMNWEVEAHLTPNNVTGAVSLFNDFRSAGPSLPTCLAENLGESDRPMGMRRFKRRGGPQSEDEYWDMDGEPLCRSGRTLRMRTRGRDFMRWAVAGPEDRLRPFNAELPHALLRDQVGLVSRLEFNWFRDPEHVEEAQGWKHTPESLLKASMLKDGACLDLALVKPAVLVSTTRVKYGIGRYPEGVEPQTEHDRFLVNIDFVTAWGAGGELLTPFPWVDIDLCSVQAIDQDEIAELTKLAGAVATAYDLRPDPRTKAQKAMAAADMCSAKARRNAEAVNP